MALNLTLQLDHGEGLMQVLHFTGLSHSVIIRPTIHGDPIFTAQAFYYLQDLESVATIRYESNEEELSEGELEYLVDNYLFAYAKACPESRISSKISRGKFWDQGPREWYVTFDQGHTEALVLDQLNDPSVKYVRCADPGDTLNHWDWRIGHNYTRPALESYISHLGDALEKKISTIIEPTAEQDGYMGKLRVFHCDDGLIDLFQAESLNNIAEYSIGKTATSIKLSSPKSPYCVDSLPIERIHSTTKYRPILLSHFFSGLKELNPLKGYIGYYNVLEYYFEEAPNILGIKAKREINQLECVLKFLTTNSEILFFLTKLSTLEQKKIQGALPTSSGLSIPGYKPTTLGEYIAELARWLYDIRCAIVHSKSTRGGKVTFSFEPYSNEAKNVNTAMPIIKWLAIRCIEKDIEQSSAPVT